MRKHKISLDKVQSAFNSAIKRRDCRCMIKDYEPCYGVLEASHYLTVGGNPALRFFPPNCYTQCSKHHFNYHNKDDSAYVHFMNSNHLSDLQYMAVARHRFIKYTDDLKAEIIRLCNEDKLDELTELIKKELG